MIQALHRYVIRKRFAKLIAPYDREIEEARAKHLPVKPIMERKAAFVRQALAGVRR